ncbi:ACP S-malonyltransferase [Paenibacillus sp. sgz5001063]|uniref:ACP S-malonyltransferase n=1 Tax=Paenibacillus sp. sgz5001063 TaxID=3242474 RepID=UPI0036D37362
MHKLALLFPGQGSQKTGMGKKWTDEFKVARHTFEEANDALGFNLQELILTGSEMELRKTENAQPAILATSIAAYRVYMQETGVEPVMVAGHSLGEFSALCAAGCLEFADAVRIVRTRGMLMGSILSEPAGTMSAVGQLSKQEIREVLARVSRENHRVVISNYNAPNQIVISGHQPAVEEASSMLEKMGARVTPLKVSAPFHSPLMEPAAIQLEEELKKYSFKVLRYPVLSNVTARPYAGPEQIIQLLVEQMTAPVRWSESVTYMRKQGITLALEMGPETVLRTLIRKNTPLIDSYAFDREAERERAHSLLVDPVSVKGKAVTIVTRCLAVAVCTKNSNPDLEEYRTGFQEPYREIAKMQESLEEQGTEPTLDQMRRSLDMLRLAFRTKRTPLEEQIERFEQIFRETGRQDLSSDYLHEWQLSAN